MQWAAQQTDNPVKLIAATFTDEAHATPVGFAASPTLVTKASDLKEFRRPRPLPLIREIMASPEVRNGSCESDVIVYSNCDIAVMPFFYQFIGQEMGSQGGPDAMIANRRTISPLATAPKDYSDLVSCFLQCGTKHAGCDCFALSREILERFDFGDCFIGNEWFDRSFMINIVAHARQPRYLEDVHLTFHLGDDRSWSREGYSDQNLFAISELEGILQRLDTSRLPKRSQAMLREFPLAFDLGRCKIRGESLAENINPLAWTHSRTHGSRLKEQFSKFLQGDDLLSQDLPVAKASAESRSQWWVALCKLLDLSPRKLLRRLRIDVRQ